jgi:hypothetical protein
MCVWRTWSADWSLFPRIINHIIAPIMIGQASSGSSDRIYAMVWSFSLWFGPSRLRYVGLIASVNRAAPVSR